MQRCCSGLGLGKLPNIWGSPLIFLQFQRCPLSVSGASCMSSYTHFADNHITVPPLVHVWWFLKGHNTTNCSTCGILFKCGTVRNASVKSEVLPSCFVACKYNNNNNNNINIVSSSSGTEISISIEIKTSQ